MMQASPQRSLDRECLQQLDELTECLQSQQRDLQADTRDASQMLVACQQELDRIERNERAVERLRLMRLADRQRHVSRRQKDAS